MEKMGTTVVGGLSLGRTKHERPRDGILESNFSSMLNTGICEFPF